MLLLLLCLGKYACQQTCGQASKLLKSQTAVSSVSFMRECSSADKLHPIKLLFPRNLRSGAELKIGLPGTLERDANRVDSGQGFAPLSRLLFVTARFQRLVTRVTTPTWV